MSKKRRKKGVIILLVILAVLALLLYLFLFKGTTKSKVIDEIKEYGYTLDDRDTELMKANFEGLKEELLKEEINYEKYGEYLSKLFIVDLYTMNNKLNKYDVGGVEYIYPEHRDNFKLKVEDTLYKYLEDLSTRKKRSETPEVKSIKIESITEASYLFNKKEYDAYEVEVNWDYVKDYGYDESGKIILIRIKDKLYIAEYTPEEVSE